MKRWFSIYLQLTRANIKRRGQYRGSIILSILALAILESSILFGFFIIIRHFQDINGWNFYQISFLVGLNHFAQGLSMIFMAHSRGFGRLVSLGQIDRWLIRPIPPFISFLGHDFALPCFGDLVSGSVILTYSLAKLGVVLSLKNVSFLIATILGGALIQSAFFVIASATSFYTEKSSNFTSLLVWNTKEFINYPISIFPSYIQIVLTFIIPFAFINFYPAHYFFKTQDILFHPVFIYLTPLIGIIAMGFAILFWQRSLQKYQGSGNS